MDFLSGSVERITFYNSENGFTVLRLRPERRNLPGLNQEGLATVTGSLPEVTPGEFLKLSGRWEKHPQHGLQFTVEVCEQSLPASVEGIRRYLGSGLIKGIGPRLAERIVVCFGEKTLDIIENQPEDLHKVPDIGEKRIQIIRLAWQEQKRIKDIMIFLHGHGVSTNLAVKIYKQYGEQSLQVVQTNPYQLARDIFGIGFKTADKLARALGLAVDHPSRIEAGLIYALNEMSNEGHVYAPEETLIARACELLNLPAELIPDGIKRLSQEDRVYLDHFSMDKSQSDKNIHEETAVYLTPFYHGEVGVAERLQLLNRSTRIGEIHSQDYLPGTDNLSLIENNLSPEQMQAVKVGLVNPVSVITGGPGTGKTTTLKTLIRVLKEEHKLYALAAPTGRAAKRLSEATGCPASTIHRLLGFSPGKGFQHNEDNPLPMDFLIIDEVSMLDLLLANHLLKAIKPGTHLILVGDVDQLPSVGAGDVLHDIIASGSVPVSRLTQIFRQASGSQIISNAHLINQGKMPLFPADNQDCFLFSVETPEEAAQWVEDIVCQRIPNKFNLDPQSQVQVLSPMYRGPVGVDALNNRLQSRLNPPSSQKTEHSFFGQLLRLGDRVMQNQNNYDKEVFNGDIGHISQLLNEEQTLTVNFDGRHVIYEWSEVDQLTLAYAITVHKSQGSEFQAIVMPIMTQHYLMLQRNLLYTAITRAQKLCVLVGNRRAIRIAVNNNKVLDRYTALDIRLGNRNEPGSSKIQNSKRWYL
jgi:exodeoxyribonuclease V alpha subunit